MICSVIIQTVIPGLEMHGIDHVGKSDGVGLCNLGVILVGMGSNPNSVACSI
jgi:hypothetical protein